MESSTKFILNSVAGQKQHNCQSYCFLSLKPYFSSDAKTKIDSYREAILFIDSMSINVSPDVNKNQDN